MTFDNMVPKVLLVEDEPLICAGIEKCLESRAEVTTASNVEEAIFQLEMDSFDLCFVDVFVPGMDGLVLMRRINQISPITKVVIMTGHYLTDATRETIKNEAHAFIEKPFSISQIREVVSDAAIPAGQNFSNIFSKYMKKI